MVGQFKAFVITAHSGQKLLVKNANKYPNRIPTDDTIKLLLSSVCFVYLKCEIYLYNIKIRIIAVSNDNRYVKTKMKS